MSAGPFCCGFCFILVFYTLFSSYLQSTFYKSKVSESSNWKIQSKRGNIGSCASTTWLPLMELLGIEPKPNRASDHAIFASINLFFACTFAGAVASSAYDGRTMLVFNVADGGGLMGILFWTSCAVFWQSVIEYYWHRLLHLPFLYKRFHKVHHHYTAPEPFDDMYIHPLEAFGYYCILYSPPFIMPLHIAGFVIYMAIMGTCGVLDHCGVRISIRGIYDSADHDMHHSRFNVNYGFPFAFTDIIHGTYLSPSDL
jgi:sterol desaturase/sphingolipid hydroxylase (fatty acid hydroxylase superfamily)